MLFARIRRGNVDRLVEIQRAECTRRVPAGAEAFGKTRVEWIGHPGLKTR